MASIGDCKHLRARQNDRGDKLSIMAPFAVYGGGRDLTIRRKRESLMVQLKLSTNQGKRTRPTVCGKHAEI